MLLLLLATGLALAADPTEVDLQPGTDATGWGVGVQIGEPSGLVLQRRPDGEDWAAQAGLTWSVAGRFGQVSADYLRRPVVLKFSEVPTLRIPILVGVGAQLDLGYGRKRGRASPVGGAIRVPLQISVTDTELPADAYVELAPSLVVAPFVGFDFDASVGIRVWF